MLKNFCRVGKYYPRKLLMDPCSNATTILIYNGKGSGAESAYLLLEALRQSLKKGRYDIRYVSPKEIIEGSWVARCRLIAFGGGYDRGFIQALGTEGTRNIKEFVQNGGSYLGLCAGAYFACDYIEFDKNGPLEVVGKRDLNFYPGDSIGPAFSGFCYNSKKGVHPVPIKYKEMEPFDAYMQGGGYFQPRIEHPRSLQVEDLGQYLTLPNQPAAVVKCRVGKGSAVLSGVHLEYTARLLKKDDPDLQKLIPRFLHSDRSRDTVFRDLLKELGLECQSPDPCAISWTETGDFMHFPATI
ncbi:uncharacterized protein TC_0305 [Aplysia californica]|uniref:Uncharacterized protein TC_0305 n=1 Tax=Aplysia californica TaxID=6500 RepID=A0ABM0JVK3_APLCA|nr:uncharacterized protein TC_0305 [Aplysia californica]